MKADLKIEDILADLACDHDAWNKLTRECSIMRDEIAALTAERDRYRLALAEIACIQAGVE